MQALPLVIAILGLSLEGALLIRSRRRQWVLRLPLFCSYVSYVFLSTLAALPVYLFWPRYYANVYWVNFIVILLAEFGVLIEISGRAFTPYPFLRRLGQFLTTSIGAVFFILYILPSALRSESSDGAILYLSQRSCVTKGVMVFALFAAARRYRLPLGRSLSGLLVGFTLFFGINTVNFTLLGWLGHAYHPVFALAGPLSYLLMLAVWTVSLWDYDPKGAQASVSGTGSAVDGLPVQTSLTYQIGRFNNVLTRLLHK